MRLLVRLLILPCLLFATPLLVGQTLTQPFPEGQVGVDYEAVRVDLLGSCSMEVEIDGVLDDSVWELAPFQPMLEYWKGGRTPCFGPVFPGDPCVDEENFYPEIAAVATEEWLYLAYRIADDTRSIDSGKGGCGAHNDDSFEMYVDWNNDKAADYEGDDVQLQFWSGDIPGPDEEFNEQATIDYEVGWINQGGCIGNENVNNHPDAPEPYVHRVWATDITDENGIPIGWQAEVQIALRVDANGKSWDISPEDGTQIGIDFHAEDDDVGGGQGGGDDSAHIWSLADSESRAWRTPSVFGQLTFRVLEDACEEKPKVGPFLRGDSNSDGISNISDASFLLNFLFIGGAEPPCAATGDSNGDGVANISDASYLLNFLFIGGPGPAAPHPECGTSETELDELLGCNDTSACEPEA